MSAIELYFIRFGDLQHFIELSLTLNWHKIHLCESKHPRLRYLLVGYKFCSLVI